MKTSDSRDTDRGASEARRGGASWLPWVICALGCAASLGVWQAMARQQEMAVQARFERDAGEREFVIEEQLRDALRGLQTTAAFFASGREIDREQFHEVARTMLELHPYVQALGWNPLVLDSDRAEHEEIQRAAGLEGYEITERDPDGRMVRAARRSHYVVVQFLEPYAGNEEALGFDVASEHKRREALELARDTGRLALTEVLTLVQERENQPGFLAFMPVYGRSQSPLPTAASLRGFVVGVIRLGSLVEGALARFEPQRIDIVVSDESAPAEARDLYASASPSGWTAATARAGQERADGSRRFRELEVGGRTWRITSIATPAYLANLRSWAPWRTLFAGLAFTLLATAYSVAVSGRAARIDRLVALRTRELRRANRALEAEVARRKEIEQELSASRDHLEDRVRERTADLEATTQSLRQAVARLESAEQALSESEQRLRFTLGAAADGAWDWNIETGEVYFSDSWIESLGYERSEVEPNVSFWEGVVHPEDLEAVRAAVARHLAGETERYECENRLRRRSGEYRWNLDRGLVVERDATGRPLRMVGTDTDIGARKAAEQQLFRAERTAEQARRFESLGVLAGGIAHDFNNLLVAILGGTDLALQGLPAGDPAREALEEVRSAASRATELTRQIHAYSGQANFAFERLDLSAVVGELEERLRASVSKKVQLRFELAEGLPPIEGDAIQLGQAVTNLVLNANDAVGDARGEISVVTRLAAGEASAAAVAVEVSDDGRGIDEALRGKIFDPFFSTKAQGRGLGLAAALGIARSHRGDLQVLPGAEQGTISKIVLPCVAPAATEEQRIEDEPTASWRGSGTVLVVDDDAAVRAVAEKMLRRIGFDVVTAGDGFEGVEVYRRYADEIVVTLLDMSMPRMGGAEAFRRIREIRAGARVVFSSGNSERAATGLLTEDPGAHFIQKPYRMADLRVKLRSAIEG